MSNNVSNDRLEHCILNDGTTKDENPEVECALKSLKFIHKFH